MRAASAAVLSIALVAMAAPARAQDADLRSSQAPPAPTASDKDGVDAGDVAQFLLGGALGLGLHESGHVIAGAAFGANPGIEGIRYGKLRVQVVAQGFQTYGEDFEIDQPDKDFVIELKRPQEQVTIYK